MDFQKLVTEFEKIAGSTTVDSVTFQKCIRAIMIACNTKSNKDLQLLNGLRIILNNEKTLDSVFSDPSDLSLEELDKVLQRLKKQVKKSRTN